MNYIIGDRYLLFLAPGIPSLSGLWNTFYFWPLEYLLFLAPGIPSLSGLWNTFSFWPLEYLLFLASGIPSLSGPWNTFSFWPLEYLLFLAPEIPSLSGLWNTFSFWPLKYLLFLASGSSLYLEKFRLNLAGDLPLRNTHTFTENWNLYCLPYKVIIWGTSVNTDFVDL